MGKDERNALSRIKVENLPKTIPSGAKKIDPLGLTRLETCPEEGKVLYVGALGPYELPNVATSFSLVIA